MGEIKIMSQEFKDLQKEIMNCEIGELKVFYRGFSDAKLNQALFDVLCNFGYRLEEAYDDKVKHIFSLVYKKECG